MVGITGCHGFLGQSLARQLDKKGLQFKALDRSGKLGKFEVIFDLAAYGNMAGHRADPYKVYKANTLRVARELEQLKGTDTKYIYMSTSSVELPVQTFYSASKKAAEEMIQIAVRDWGIKACIARPFSITGIGEQWDHLIPTMLMSCETKKQMPFVPEPVHDFIDVDDVVDALLVISEKGLFEGEVYDIGSSVQTSNQEILDIVRRVTGKEPNLEYVKSLRKYDNKSWRSNPSMLKRLGWRYKKTLAQSIKETWDSIQLGMMA